MLEKFRKYFNGSLDCGLIVETLESLRIVTGLKTEAHF
jgi:hypothetical protein